MSHGEPLGNPIRSICTSFTCHSCGYFDPDGQSKTGILGEGPFLCQKCVKGEGADPKSLRCAFASLIYGDAAKYVLGGLVLGQSLQATKTPHACVLLHTSDVPEPARLLLAEFWTLQEVDYIESASDLHTPADARFKRVFTKLQIFDPQVLPYDRVAFLDLDMLVLQSIDELFQVRPPAAMCNLKFRDNEKEQQAVNLQNAASLLPAEHGDRMRADASYINAGTMVVAPSAWLHDLLARDVQELDAQWHHASWAPEQAYLSHILAGEWSHLSQLYNMEVQLHPGVPLTNLWSTAEAADVRIAHFSGAVKAWDLPPQAEASVLASPWVRQNFAALPARSQSAATVRCAALHAEWHRRLALALARCRKKELPGLPDFWANLLRAGGLGGPAPAPASPLPGEELVLWENGHARLCTAVRAKGSAGERLVVWASPWPDAASPFCAGELGLCFDVPAAACRKAEEEGLGRPAVAWLGQGHVTCSVVGRRASGLLLLRFAKCHAPVLLEEADLLLPRPGKEAGARLQCARCLGRLPGAFGGDGFWYCRGCGS